MPILPFHRPLRLRRDASVRDARTVTWLELFFDLAFVAAVAQVVSPLSGDASLAGLVRAAFLFLLIWWAWIGHTTFSTRFDTDDLAQRGLTLVQMFLVAAMAINATGPLEGRDSAGFAAAYAGMRGVLVLQYWRAARIASSRPLARAYAGGIGAAALLWLASSVSPVPVRLGVWAAALSIDLAVPLVAERHGASVPADREHLPERFGLFTLILFGETLVALMKGMERQEGWSLGAASAALLSLATIFALWWAYFDGVSGAAERPTRTRREVVCFQIWTYAHLPLYLGMVVVGVGLEHLVAEAHAAHLHVVDVARLGGALAVMLAALTLIGATKDAAERQPLLAVHLRGHLPFVAGAVALGTVGALLPPPALVVLLLACTLGYVATTSMAPSMVR